MNAGKFSNIFILDTGRPTNDSNPALRILNIVSSSGVLEVNAPADYREALSQEERYIRNRNTKLKQAYGISHDDYLLMLEQQNYKCACCGKDNKDAGIKGLVVDHNHTTGVIRELLCTQCNTALGLLKEDEFIIDNLLDYVRKHNR